MVSLTLKSACHLVGVKGLTTQRPCNPEKGDFRRKKGVGMIISFN